MKLITWNCKGLGNSGVRRSIKDLCRMNQPDVLCLLETRSNSAFALSLPSVLPFSKNHRVPSEGFAGDLWVFWQEKNVSLSVLEDDRQFIHMLVETPGKRDWVITFADVRPNQEDKLLFWEKMEEFSQRVTLPWALSGDLNDYSSHNEKIGGSISDSRCNTFRSWYENCGLYDIGAAGPKFTWWGPMINNRRIRIRLDRVLVNTEWQELFAEGAVLVLPRTESDHHPIQLSTFRRSVMVGQKPFRFQAAWNLHHEFKPLFQSVWLARKHL